jgi:hypothetical protein
MSNVEMDSARAGTLLRTPKDQRPESDADIMTAWADWLYETHGSSLSRPVLDKVYAKAWENGHAYGLSEVEEHFRDLVDFAWDILGAR